ncbi:MAG: hypothetical protein ACOWYE_00680 [Desulfatiglandales bacterium]
MKLRVKILSGFMILALMLLIAGAWSIYQLNLIGVSVQRLLDDNYKSIKASNAMLQAVEREDSAVLLLLMGKWEEGRKILKSAQEAFVDGFEIAQNNLTVPGEKDYVDHIKAKHEFFSALWAKPIVDTEKEGDLNWYFTTMHKAFLDLKSSINELKTLNEEALYQTASGLKSRANRAVVPGTVAIVSALLFSLIFSYLVNLFMVSPIIRITRAIEDFTRKGMPFDVQVETSDEIRDLSVALSALCAKVSAVERDR